MALPPPSAKTGVYVSGEFTGKRVDNVLRDMPLHRIVKYPANSQTPFLSNLVCTSGVAGPNNDCICPQSQSAPPFRQQPPKFTSAYTNALFSPTPGAYNPMPTAVDAYLIHQRSPLPNPLTSFRTSNYMPLR